MSWLRRLAWSSPESESPSRNSVDLFIPTHTRLIALRVKRTLNEIHEIAGAPSGLWCRIPGSAPRPQSAGDLGPAALSEGAVIRTAV